MHLPLLFLIFTLTAYNSAFADDNTGLDLTSGWNARVITECADEMPDMLLLSADEQHLYQSCETRSNMMSPSLARINIQTGERTILLYGLSRADGMRFSPDGDIWLGEETGSGMVWKITNPDALKEGQRADRVKLIASSVQIKPVLEAGIFSHEGLTFSANGQFLYLADEWSEGCIYRLNIPQNKLEVFHANKGWLTINNPQDARIEAEKLHGTWYKRLEDMELMSDGTILISETDTGRILRLDDTGDKPFVSLYLEHPEIEHPDNLEWDKKRGWLWLSDDSIPSELWAWDGKAMHLIASHDLAEITGIESGKDGTIYFNLQHRRFAPDLTVSITNNTHQ